MGFFKRIGRQVEQFKQTATKAAEEDATYRCRDCDARFHTQHNRCSECDSESIVSMATVEGASDPSAE
jgi:DNA-directed RNA polymerase subunit RPC12/RpoP